jgi:hypothetical protein
MIMLQLTVSSDNILACRGILGGGGARGRIEASYYKPQVACSIPDKVIRFLLSTYIILLAAIGPGVD